MQPVEADGLCSPNDSLDYASSKLKQMQATKATEATSASFSTPSALSIDEDLLIRLERTARLNAIQWAPLTEWRSR